MKRILHDADKVPRFDRWSFDDPMPVAPKAREDRTTQEAHEDKTTQKAHEDWTAPKAHEDWAELKPRTTRPAPRPAAPAQSPWRKIQIPDDARRRAAAAGLYRYVGEPPPAPPAAPISQPPAVETAPVETVASPAAPPIAALLAETEPAVTPLPYPNEAEEAVARVAAVRARYARRIDAPRSPPAPQGNPHVGLTVGIIVAVSVVAAIGLSWIAAPAIDASPPQRADILQRFAPQAQTAEQPPAKTPGSIEVAPDKPRTPPVAPAVQPIEVAP